jgi:D-threo-aldose 1-dehydrogenase
VTSPPRTDWIRPLGSTGLQITAVTMGGGPLGSMPENFGRSVDYDDGVALVRHVLSSPVRAIDTSNGYSGGESERRIGAGIRACGGLPGDFLITTKVDGKGRDYSGKRVRESVAESKQRLGLNPLPMVFLHDPEYHDFAEMTKPGGAVDTLRELREEGEIEHIGLAGGPVQEMSRYLALGGFEVLLVHNRWTLVDRSATELIAQAKEAGIAVVNAAIYGGGLLAKPRSGITTYMYQPAPPEILQAVAVMDRLCVEHGTDLATAALQASVRDPQISTTIVGLSTPQRLDSLLASLQVHLPDTLFDELADRLPAQEHWVDFRRT